MNTISEILGKTTDEIKEILKQETLIIFQSQTSFDTELSKTKINICMYELERRDREKQINTIKKNSRISSIQNVIMIILTVVMLVLTIILVYKASWPVE